MSQAHPMWLQKDIMVCVQREIYIISRDIYHSNSPSPRLRRFDRVHSGACWPVADFRRRGSSAGSFFSVSASIAAHVAPLTAYIAPSLLLKTLAGLFGQYLAVSGRGALGTWILLLVQWCLGLPASWWWASASESADMALMQAQTVSWFVAAACFWVAYTQLGRGTAAVAAPANVAPPLAKPLLTPSGQPTPA